MPAGPAAGRVEAKRKAWTPASTASAWKTRWWCSWRPIENEGGIHGEKCASRRAGCQAGRDQVSGAKARRASGVVVGGFCLARSHRRFHTRLSARIHRCSRAAVLLHRQGTRGVSDLAAGRGLGSARGSKRVVAHATVSAGGARCSMKPVVRAAQNAAHPV